MGIIDQAAGSAHGARFYLYALLTCEGVKLALRHGLAPQSPRIFCDYALVLCALPGGDVEEGFDVGVLATSLAERGESALSTAKVVLVGVGATWQFKRHLRDTLGVLEPLYPQLKEAGEFVWAGYVMLWYSCYGFLTGRDLAWFERRMGEYYADLRRIGAEQARLRLATFRQAAQNLLGRSACPWVLDGEAYDRAAVVPALEASGNVSTLALLHVNTLMLGYLFERYDDALAASEAAET
jgi:predicted ATPase